MLGSGRRSTSERRNGRRGHHDQQVAVIEPFDGARVYTIGFGVGQFWDDITRAYDQHIQAPGKETHFLILIAFVLSFGVHPHEHAHDPAQVSWWPGNVETKSGTHIHHLVWGILLLLVMGYVGIATAIPDPWFELVAIAFGIGMGLTMDEFALWLNLKDVYWQEKGRQSIDAVVVTTGLLVIALLGLRSGSTSRTRCWCSPDSAATNGWPSRSS